MPAADPVPGGNMHCIGVSGAYVYHPNEILIDCGVIHLLSDPSGRTTLRSTMFKAQQITVLAEASEKLE